MSSWLKKITITAVLLGFAGATGFAQVGPPPIITVQPLGLSVPEKGTAVMSVMAASATALSYQWYQDGTSIKDATTASYVIGEVKAKDAGTYHVVVRNASGTARSADAALKVTAKVKTQLPIKNAKKSPAGFEIELDGLTVPQCVVYASSDMVNWTPIATNTVVAGAARHTDVAANHLPGRFYKVMDE